MKSTPAIKMTMLCPVCEKPITTEDVICPNEDCAVHLESAQRELLKPGTLLGGGRYQVEYVLGKGGFGITYRAVQKRLGKLFAIKEFYPSEHVLRDTTSGRVHVGTRQSEHYQRGLKRFEQEGRCLAELEHPHIVPVSDFFEENNTAYLVMRYLHGHTLRHELNAANGRGLGETRIREVVGPIVAALDMVHRLGIHHLDIKPDNIMIEETGRVVLIDFGASRQGLGTTTTQAFAPAYAPPELRAYEGLHEEFEQIRIGPESDIFELGVMLHEMLTGKRPPDAISRLVEAGNLSEEQPAPWQPQLNEPWQSAVSQALRLKPEERPRDVAAWWNQTKLQPAPPKPVRGRDVRLAITLTPQEAARGSRKAYGDAQVGQGIAEFKPGVVNGYVEVLTGRGDPGRHGGAAGDLLLEVNVAGEDDTPVAGEDDTPKAKRFRRRFSLHKVPLGIGLLAVLLVAGLLFLPRLKGTGGRAAQPVPVWVCEKTGDKATPFCPGKLLRLPAPQKERLAACTQHDGSTQRAANQALLRAAGEGNRTALIAALSQGAQPSAARDDGGNTALHLAARSGHMEILDQLLDFSSMQKLIEAKNDPTGTDPWGGNTALALAAQSGQAAIVHRLLEATANVNVRNEYEQTPLMLAAYEGHKNVVCLLLQRGADPKLTDRGTNEGLFATALDYAFKHEEIAPLLQGDLDGCPEETPKSKATLKPTTTVEPQEAGVSTPLNNNRSAVVPEKRRIPQEGQQVVIKKETAGYSRRGYSIVFSGTKADPLADRATGCSTATDRRKITSAIAGCDRRRGAGLRIITTRGT